jgi:hypothetical protein
VIQAPTASAAEQPHVIREALLRIDPDATSLEDLYQLIGHPTATKALTNTVALRYPSGLGKLPHIVVIDAAGKAQRSQQSQQCFSARLRLKGKLIVADTITRAITFFQGLAIVAAR